MARPDNEMTMASSRTQKILLADDERSLRITTAKLMELAGFEVVLAADGIEAVARFKECEAQLSAVLLDLAMPRMDGLEAMRVMREVNPKVPIVLTTGSMDPLLEGAPEADARLEKPYTWESLKRVFDRLGVSIGRLGEGDS